MKQHPTHKDLWITPDGRVFRELHPSPSSGGYHLIRNGKIKERRHVLVCQAYHGLGKQGQQVRHKNGKPCDDRAINVKWGSSSDNHEDMIAHGKSTPGTKNKQAKLLASQVKQIRSRRLEGETGRALAKEFGVNEGTICDIIKGRTWTWLE